MSEKKYVGTGKVAKVWGWIKSFFVKSPTYNPETIDGVEFLYLKGIGQGDIFDEKQHTKWYNEMCKPLEERIVKIVCPKPSAEPEIEYDENSCIWNPREKTGKVEIVRDLANERRLRDLEKDHLDKQLYIDIHGSLHGYENVGIAKKL